MIGRNRAAVRAGKDAAHPQTGRAGWSKGASLVAVVCWMAIIFALSAQPAAESSGLSLHISEYMAEKAVDILPHEYTSGVSVHAIALLIQPMLRKVAHVVEFALLGALLFLWARCWAFRRAALLAVGIGCLYAGLDEFHQLWVPGRGGQWADVLLDSSGVVAGIGFFMIVRRMRRVFRKAAALLACCLLCGCFANQARQPLLLERLDAPVVEIPDLSKPAVKTIAFSWPVQGPVSSAFGMRIHPILAELRPHRGIDIAAPMKSPVLAVAPGKVIAVHERDTGYGLSVEIEHAPGIRTRYAHMDSVAVRLHDTLDQNNVVGTVGNTGLSTGPHLHFEVLLSGKAIDPRPVLENRDAALSDGLSGYAVQHGHAETTYATTHIKEALSLFTSSEILFF